MWRGALLTGFDRAHRMTMPLPLDPEERERYLLDVEEILVADEPLRSRLQSIAVLLGSRLGIQRVVIYGEGRARDDTSRIRVEWSTPGRARLGTWIDAIPLLTEAAASDELVVATPRGTHCPSDCPTTLGGCALRGACSSILEPIRVGEARFGTLALHEVPGTPWSEQHRSLAAGAARRIALEIALTRGRQVAQELDAQRAGIAATVLHQVATPVTVIEGVVDRLRTHPDDLHMLLDVAGAEVERLHRLCDDLATIADGASPGDHDASRRCDVATTVATCVRRARDEHGAAASIELRVDQPLRRAGCDPRNLERILGRVLDNAVRYGSRPAHVDVICWSDESRTYVSVRDDGAGVTAAQAAILGEPFARLDPDMRDQPGGRGLGLAIGRQLARSDGGDLHIEPRTDAPGTQVTLALPVAKESW
jgi:signal transduction histidine kinase